MLAAARKARRVETRTLLVSLCGLLACSIAQASDSTSPVAIEQMLSVRAFPWQSTLSMSPDGLWVAYTLMEYDHRLLGGTRWTVYTASGVPNSVDGSEVWIANTVTHEQRRISRPQSSSWAPAFSPSGGRIAFYSDANGKARLWLYDLDKQSASVVSEAQVRVTSAYENPVWSATGGVVYTKLLPMGSETPRDDSAHSDGERPIVRVFRSPVEQAGTVAESSEGDRKSVV